VCPFIINMKFKNSCIVLKLSPLYTRISLRLEFVRVVKQEAFEGLDMYLRWLKQETQTEFWSETHWKMSSMLIRLYNDRVPN
jgi:hypothetical protein